MYIIAVYCWARTLKTRLQRHQATPHSPGPPQGAERSHPRAPRSRGGGGGRQKKKKKKTFFFWGGGVNFFFFFWAPPPPRARERAELSDENTGPRARLCRQKPTETDKRAPRSRGGGGAGAKKKKKNLGGGVPIFFFFFWRPPPPPSSRAGRALRRKHWTQ